MLLAQVINCVKISDSHFPSSNLWSCCQLRTYRCTYTYVYIYIDQVVFSYSNLTAFWMRSIRKQMCIRAPCTLSRAPVESGTLFHATVAFPYYTSNSSLSAPSHVHIRPESGAFGVSFGSSSWAHMIPVALDFKLKA